MEKFGRRCKELMVDELKGKINSNADFFVTNYGGLKASEMDLLRGSLREVSSDYCIVKNTILRLVFKDIELDSVDKLINGPTALAFYSGDCVTALKRLFEFKKGRDSFKILGGYVDGAVLSDKDVKELSLLPPKEMLYAKIAGCMAGPLSGLVNVLQGTIGGFVRVIDRIREKKSD